MLNFTKIVITFVMFILMIQMFILGKDTKDKRVITPIVTVTTFPLFDITKHIAKDSIKIVNILPFGVDIHHFKPTQQLLSSLEKSKLIIYSGAGLEPWTNKFNFKNSSLNISKHINLREIDSDEYEHHSHHDKQCVHNKIDPHYWLDIENMKIATTVITQELSHLFPSHKNSYMKHKNSYIKMLEQLDTEYKNSLKDCYKDTIITNYNAFSYLAKKYHFKTKSLNGLFPSTETSTKDRTRLINNIKDYKITTLFSENFGNNRVIKSIAKETNIKIDTLHPLSNLTKDETNKNITYEIIMKKNLEKIFEVLMCQ